MTMSDRRSSTQRGAVGGVHRGLTPGERGGPPYPKLVGGVRGRGQSQSSLLTLFRNVLVVLFPCVHTPIPARRGPRGEKPHECRCLRSICSWPRRRVSRGSLSCRALHVPTGHAEPRLRCTVCRLSGRHVQ